MGGLFTLQAMPVWLTPPWLLGVGAAAGLVVLVVFYFLAKLVSRRAGAFLDDSLREGFLRPVLVLALIMAAIAGLSSLVVPVGDLTRSLVRLPSAGALSKIVPLAPDAQDETVDLGIRPAELKTLEIASDQDLTITKEEYGIIKQEQTGTIHIYAGEPWKWMKAGEPDAPEKSEKGLQVGENNLFYGDSSVMHVKNLGGKKAEVRFTGRTTEEFPEVAVAPYTAFALIGLVALFLLFKLLCPKIAAIALATSREATIQPLFLIVAVIGLFFLLVAVVIPYNTLGEDVKQLIIGDLPGIRMFAIIVALWTASESVSSEIEGRTAMTVLSKPVGRRQFLLGKFVGVLLPVAFLFLMLGAFFMLTISAKVYYDARETANLPPNWQACCDMMIRAVPGLLLAFMETVTLAAVCVALSTRLPLMANLIVCCSVYVLGHLVPILVLSPEVDDATHGIIHFVGQLFAAVLPVLDHFDVEASVLTGKPVPLAYMGAALGYCLLYSTVAMLLALVLFEDRDLA